MVLGVLEIACFPWVLDCYPATCSHFGLNTRPTLSSSSGSRSYGYFNSVATGIGKWACALSMWFLGLHTAVGAVYATILAVA